MSLNKGIKEIAGSLQALVLECHLAYLLPSEERGLTSD
jgi:hypothetical protein